MSGCGSRWLLAALLVLPPCLAADEAWTDYAEVIHAEPLGGAAPDCARAAAAGDLRAAEPTLDLAQAVRRLAAGPDCEDVGRRATAWRVVYRYEGHEYVRVLPYEPGDRLRVQVRMDPRP